MTDPEKLPQIPILIKRHEGITWPEDETIFYVASSDGLFICRNSEFFKSCAPARSWPCELSPQEASFDSRYPKIKKRQFEDVVGFFSRIMELHNSEAAVLLVWDRKEKKVHLRVPEQVATVSRTWSGANHPIGLHYFPPTQLPPHQFVFGDIHSHVRHAAYASGTDVHDEAHGAGLHIVVGRLHEEPPDIHIEAVVDGARFSLAREAVLDGYELRSAKVPDSWLARVRVEEVSHQGWYTYEKPEGRDEPWPERGRVS